MYILTLRSRVPARVVPLATLVVVALATAPALGDEPPAFTAAPVIDGPAAVGQELRITGAWSGAPAPAQLYAWGQCDASGLFCNVVQDACSASYVVGNGDVGRRLRAQVQLFNAAGATVALTPPSGLVVEDGRDDGGKQRDRGGGHDRGGSSTDGQGKGDKGRGDRGKGHVFDAVGTTAAITPFSGPLAGAAKKGPDKPDQGGSPTGSCAPVVPPAPPVAPAAPPAAAPTAAASPLRPYQRPFPTVRIAGYTVAGGARITRVSVRGGSSAVVRATCVGAGCRRRALSPAHPPARLRALERFFRAGTVLQIRVTAGATIGKYTSFRILARHAPRRADRCLMPGRWAPVRCPARDASPNVASR